MSTAWAVDQGIKEDTSARNTKQASKILNIPFVHNKYELEIARETSKSLYPHTVFVGYVGAMLFSPWCKELNNVLRNAKRIIHFRDEWRDEKYITAVNRYLKLSSGEVWTSIRYMVNEKQSIFFLNLNKSGYDPAYNRKWNPQKKYYGLFYWGSPRKDRISTFKRLLDPSKFDVYIAEAKHVLLEWQKLFPEVHLIHYDAPYVFNCFQMTIYVEDDWMITHDCSISCRFYESLRCGIPILFDSRSIPNFDRAGIKILDHWVVETAEDIASKLPQSQQIHDEQQKHFAKYDFYGEFVRDFKTLCKKRGII